MGLSFAPMDEDSARVILAWRYEPPYDVYNSDPARFELDVQALVDPENRIYRILDQTDELVALCSVGADAQVPGGDYRAEALDVGLGVRPDLTGQGNGAAYAEAVLDFAHRTCAPRWFRVTVAAFNARALRVWHKLGFREVQRFERQGDGMPFLVLTRAAAPTSERKPD